MDMVCMLNVSFAIVATGQHVKGGIDDHREMWLGSRGCDKSMNSLFAFMVGQEDGYRWMSGGHL